MFAVQRKHCLQVRMGTATFHLECIRGGLVAVPRDAGEWKLPADSVLSGMNNLTIIHLDKCYAGIPARECRKPAA